VGFVVIFQIIKFHTQKKIPKLNIQIPKKMDNWNLELGIWSLELGIWNLVLLLYFSS